MQDVAERAGVSASTVSRVVNDDRYVGKQTRVRVEAAIAELGFQPNRMAQRLRPGRPTDTIALLIEDVSNPFYSAIAQGVESVAQQQRHLLVLGTTRRDFDQERGVLEELLRRRVDGLLIVPSTLDKQPYVDLSRWAPMVFIDRRPAGMKTDVVVLDNRTGAREVVARLVTAGHRRIGYVGGAASVGATEPRLTGYRTALERAGIAIEPALVHLNNHDTAAARAAGRAMFAAADPPTAVFADNNRMTVGVLEAIHERGSGAEVAGFDDVELADLLKVPVALVTYDAFAMGRRAAELLFERIAEPERAPRRVVIPTEVVPHGVTGPADEA
jgi:LacI family transcriptional regulator